MTTGAPRVLIVDDEPSMVELIRATLEVDGFDVVGVATDGTEAVHCFDDLAPPPSAVVLDQRMPGLSGLEAAELILERHPPQMVILFSAALSDELVTLALNAGVQQCVDKLEVRRLPRVLRTLLGV